MTRRRSPALWSIGAALALLWHVEAIDAQTYLATGENADITAEGLHRVDPLIMEAAWVKPGFDLTRFTKVLLMPTAVQFRDVPKRQTNALSRISETEFPLDDVRKEWFRQLWSRLVKAEFAQEEVYQTTDGVGPDVLVVQAYLVDVVSHIPPDTAGSSFMVVSDPWSVVIVLELRDSTTTELLARTIDRRLVQGKADLGEVWYRTETVAEEWAQVVTNRLQQLSDLGGHDRTPDWAR